MGIAASEWSGCFAATWTSRQRRILRRCESESPVLASYLPDARIMRNGDSCVNENGEDQDSDSGYVLSDARFAFAGLRPLSRFESLRHFQGYFLEHAALRSPLAIPNSRGVATTDALCEMDRLRSKIHSCKFLRMIHLAGGLLVIWRILLSVFMLSNARPLILSPLELCIAIYATSERRWSRKEP